MLVLTLITALASCYNPLSPNILKRKNLEAEKQRNVLVFLSESEDAEKHIAHLMKEFGISYEEALECDIEARLNGTVYDKEDMTDPDLE